MAKARVGFPVRRGLLAGCVP